MKLVFFSDTHGLHNKICIPDGDILIFCGDMCPRSTIQDVRSFSEFLKLQHHKHKIVIAGNHDFPFEDTLYKDEAEKLIEDTGAIYLNDSGITIEGVNFWGSPIQPRFFDWAFNRDRGHNIKQHWDLIPDNTDVLITHGPPQYIMDLCKDSSKVGCKDLLETIRRIKPSIHAFGHIHESYGIQEIWDTTFINACSLDHNYRVRNEPIIVELDKDKNVNQVNSSC